MGAKVSGSFPSLAVTTHTAAVVDAFAEELVNECPLVLAHALQRSDSMALLARLTSPATLPPAGGDSTNQATVARNRRVFWPPFYTAFEENQLERPTQVPSRPWLEGFMYKRGKINTEWKQRWFIQHNRARNYELEYRSATNVTKGFVSMTGMTIHGAPGFVLVLEPVDRSRVYYLRAKDRVEQKQWKYVLQFAASKAVPVLHPSPLVRQVLLGALSKTRHRFGLFAPTTNTGTEQNQLISLAIQQCEGDIAPALAALAEESEDSRVKLQVQLMDSLYSQVSSLVNRARKECEAGLERVRPVFVDVCTTPADASAIVTSCEIVERRTRIALYDALNDRTTILIATRLVPFLLVAGRVSYKSSKCALRKFRNHLMALYGSGRVRSASSVITGVATGPGADAGTGTGISSTSGGSTGERSRSSSTASAGAGAGATTAGGSAAAAGGTTVGASAAAVASGAGAGGAKGAHKRGVSGDSIVTSGSGTSGTALAGDDAASDGEEDLTGSLNAFMMALRFPMDGLATSDSWIMSFTRPKSASASEKARLKTTATPEQIKSMLAPMKLRAFEVPLINRTHKATSRAIFSVAPPFLSAGSREEARVAVDSVAQRMAHDLRVGVCKELSLLCRSLLAANLLETEAMEQFMALSNTVSLEGVPTPYVTLGFVSVREAVRTAIGKFIAAAVDECIATHVHPLLAKLAATAVEDLPETFRSTMPEFGLV